MMMQDTNEDVLANVMTVKEPPSTSDGGRVLINLHRADLNLDHHFLHRSLHYPEQPLSYFA